MIGTLAGVLAFKSPPHLLLEVGGVGYEVEAPMSTFYTLPAVGERTRLLTHLVVREDAHILYGFATAEERTLFRNLLKVSGVGPKIALGILSGMSVTDFMRCIEAEDAALLVRIPGVGRKTAERVLIDMRDRVGEFGADAASVPFVPGAKSGSAQQEAFSALVALGYRPAEIARLLKSVGEDATTTAEIIRRALQSAAG